MPLIIAATDFSAVADNAVKYACNLALAQNTDVAVIHTYSIPLTLGDLTVPLPISDFKAEAEDGMNRLMGGLSQDYPQINFRSAIIFGNVIDAIEDFVGENEEPMLVVVGNSSTPDNPTFMDGILLDAFRSLKYPILAVPQDVAYEQVRKIGFVYDNELGGSEHALQQLAELALTLRAELHVHYNQPDAQERNDEVNNGARGLLNAATPVYHYTHEKDIDASILDFTSRFQLDWLIVMPRRHSFFEGLFHKSHTKAIVNNTFIPVMALHESDV